MARHRRRSTHLSPLVEQSGGGFQSRVLPSNVSWSIVTNTDSTTSSIFGPGRTIGALLSASGRRFEEMVNKTAERLGYGPNAVMTRLLNLVRQAHERSRICKDSGPNSGPSSSRSALPFADLLDSAMLLGSSTCPRCHRPFFTGLVRTTEFEEPVRKLLNFISQGHVSTKCLAIYHLGIVAMVDNGLRELVLRLGGADALRTLQLHIRTAVWAKPEWRAMAEPLQQALYILESPTYWFGMFTQEIHGSIDMALYNQIREEVTALVENSKLVYCFGSIVL
jgi:hypothetical protein